MVEQGKQFLTISQPTAFQFMLTIIWQLFNFTWWTLIHITEPHTYHYRYISLRHLRDYDIWNHTAKTMWFNMLQAIQYEIYLYHTFCSNLSISYELWWEKEEGFLLMGFKCDSDWLCCLLAFNLMCAIICSMQARRQGVWQKGPLLATKWSKNGVFVVEMGVRFKKSTFLGPKGPLLGVPQLPQIRSWLWAW